MNTLCHAFCNHFAKMLQVVVLPFVPVTQTIVISLEGKPYEYVAITALIL
jgi:hypothetical protein